MNLYLAGVYELLLHSYMKNPAYIHRGVCKKHKKMPYLESYYYLRKNPEQVMGSIAKRKDTIFCDSGAFSAFTQGVTVDLEEYAKFIQQYQKYIHVASNFDVIGRGKEQESYENQRILESYGAKVCPVHHARDKDKWLEKYIGEGHKYIFLGGMVPESTTYLKNWLDRVWGNILTDKEGKPIVKVHGFGLTIEDMMLRYPWYSVDSTSWKIYAAMSFLVLPTQKRGLQSLAMSNQAPSRKQRGRHYNHLSPTEKAPIKALAKKRGFTIKQLQNDAMSRAVFNGLTYRKFMKKANWPNNFHYTHRGLFDERSY